MTPYQGDTPNDPRGRQPSGNEYQQPPTRQPQQPPTGQFQGQPGRSTQQGPPGQSQPRPAPQSQPTAQQGRMAQGQPLQSSPQSQPGGAPPGMAPQGVQPQANTGMQAPQATQSGQGAAQLGQQRGAQSGQVRLRPIRVEEIVQTDVATAQSDTPIATVVSKMADRDVGSIVVVENDQPTGVITDRKVALALENTPDVAQKQAGDLVSGDLVTGTTSMSVFDALEQLSDEGIRRLPIVDDDGSLRGIVTLDDILVLLGSELNRIGETIKKQSPRY